MVARGRGKKAAVAAVAAASETIENVTNGDENGGTSEVVAPVAAAKKGRVRGAKKDEAVETQTVEIVQKSTKPLKAPKGSKKTPKGKASEAEQEKIEENDVAKEKTGKDDVPVEEPEQEVVDKKTSNRKRKNDSAEKGEDAAPVTKKAPRVTKTKAAKKETVDIDGIPENPAAAAAFAVVPEAQTNGNKKSSSRKRAAPKIEEPVAPIVEAESVEPETEIAPQAAKKSSKSKGAKKETKKTSKAPKSKESKKAAKAVEEDAPEDDILPEDEFVPEIEEEEEEKAKEIEEEKEKEPEPKARKPVKSKGSRKQLKEDVVTPVEEVVLENNKKEEPELESEPQESEVDSVKEEPQQKSKGKKAPAAKKASTKKAAAKKPSKSKKGSKEEQEEILKNEEQQDEADVVISKPKTNGTVKPTTEPVEKKTGRGRKRATPEAADEPEASKTKKPALLLNPTVTEYKSSTFGLDKDFKLKISSWNIAGLRSWLKKDGLDYLQHEQPDILCLQETKCTTDQLPEESRIPGYHPYWLCMPGGHAGVAVYSKIMPINVEYGIGNADHDVAGRMITAEYEKFYLVCVYVPNSGRKLVNLASRMQWEELFRKYIQGLEKVKPVIIAGDMNVAHNEIDLANPKTNTKNAGFTPQEREQMTKLLELGYVDTFRHLYPEQKGAYTFWSYMGGARSKNVGWRLDYFIVSDRITSKVVESAIRPQVLGSDHCPITLFLNI